MSGPVVVITGAGSGIGLACARELAGRGNWSLALFDRDESALNRGLWMSSAPGQKSSPCPLT